MNKISGASCKCVYVADASIVHAYIVMVVVNDASLVPITIKKQAHKKWMLHASGENIQV